MDNVSKTLLALLAAAIVLLVGVGIYLHNRNEEYARVYTMWVKTCRDKGGSVEITAYKWSDCIIDKKVVVLPGYEFYQKDAPR